jgi:hypothetical protein
MAEEAQTSLPRVAIPNSIVGSRRLDVMTTAGDPAGDQEQVDCPSLNYQILSGGDGDEMPMIS